MPVLDFRKRAFGYQRTIRPIDSRFQVTGTGRNCAAVGAGNAIQTPTTAYSRSVENTNVQLRFS